MILMTTEMFKEIYSADIADRVETIKGDKFSPTYMSWAEAWKQAKEIDAECTFEVLEDEDGFPVFSRGDMHFVKTRVTLAGVTQQCNLPVMDHRHNAKKTIDARDVNDSVQRCLAKNLALFGIGLALYNGEDLEQFRKLSDEDRMKKEMEADITRVCKADQAAMAIYEEYKAKVKKPIKSMSVDQLSELAKLLKL